MEEGGGLYLKLGLMRPKRNTTERERKGGDAGLKIGLTRPKRNTAETGKKGVG